MMLETNAMTVIMVTRLVMLMMVVKYTILARILM
jgi:hypothetical protein